MLFNDHDRKLLKAMRKERKNDRNDNTVSDTDTDTSTDDSDSFDLTGFSGDGVDVDYTITREADSDNEIYYDTADDEDGLGDSSDDGGSFNQPDIVIDLDLIV